MTDLLDMPDVTGNTVPSVHLNVKNKVVKFMIHFWIAAAIDYPELRDMKIMLISFHSKSVPVS